MIDTKLDLLVDNNKELGKSGGLLLTRSPLKQCNALSLMIKNRKADGDRVKEAVKIVKKNTNIFSYFRGGNLLTTAVTIAQEENMEYAMREILYIYNNFRTAFAASRYLAVAAIVVFNARHKIAIDTAINNTYIVYKSMDENHIFLTGAEDITAAATIAVTSEDLERSMNEIEECYKLLRKNKFLPGENLQSLSHMMVVFNGTVEEKVSRIVELRKALRKRRVPIKGYYLPLLAVASSCMYSSENFADKVYEVNRKLKKHKGFGSFHLQSDQRRMLALGVVCSSYVDMMDEGKEDSIVNTTNNIAIAIQIAMETAALRAASRAAANASRSGGN